MSLIENAPQKQKSYNEQQDHGTADEQKGHSKPIYDNDVQHKKIAKVEDDQFKQAIADTEADYYSMSPEGLEAAADTLLEETAPHTTSSLRFIPSIETVAQPFNSGEEEDEIDDDKDRFLSEAEVDQLSKKRIRDKLAKQATLDYDFDKEDDFGDDYYASPIRIKNRL